jgi:hypothetical protein
MWQTDFTYFKIAGWRRYYPSTILGDHYRFIVPWRLCTSMNKKIRSCLNIITCQMNCMNICNVLSATPTINVIMNHLMLADVLCGRSGEIVEQRKMIKRHRLAIRKQIHYDENENN